MCVSPSRAMLALVAVLPVARALSAPTITSLKEQLAQKPAGAALAAEFALRKEGKGSPHRASRTRVFDDGAETRVTLYRDSAAWCPYCQKLWMMLEEKEINYAVELINMRSYGDKPASFTAKVRGGILPALELDGTMYTESLDIMAMLDDAFADGRRALLPDRESPEWERTRALLRLERSLFSAWCAYVFGGGFGSKRNFEAAMRKVDAALGDQPGPWFSDFSDGPSLVDLQYVSHVERIAASVPYWRGDVVRGSGAYPNVDRWFEAFEARPSYAASRSDWYTHVNDIPPQYGPGVPSNTPDQKAYAAALDGGDAAWRLPLPPLAASDAPSDALQPGWEAFEADAATEAAYHVIDNLDAVAAFAARAKAAPGGWAPAARTARLADPLATPAEGAVRDAVQDALLVVAQVLLADCDVAAADVASGPRGARRWRPRRRAQCAAYLRERVGVPRDVRARRPARRATLNWVSDAAERA
ncbi:chloride channel [Aureococcus anophagefferens]|uniref:Chloride channel n=1 Tax=Aureococcus anophagefferens TaxID=44056 RepID=A0ABR1FMH6_AURAN